MDTPTAGLDMTERNAASRSNREGAMRAPIAAVAPLRGGLQLTSSGYGETGSVVLAAIDGDRPLRMFTASFSVRMSGGSCGHAGISEHCGAEGITRMEEINGSAVWIMVILLCTLGCILGCCFLPFCVKKLRNYHFYCKSCGSNIANKLAM